MSPLTLGLSSLSASYRQFTPQTTSFATNQSVGQFSKQEPQTSGNLQISQRSIERQSLRADGDSFSFNSTQFSRSRISATIPEITQLAENSSFLQEVDNTLDQIQGLLENFRGVLGGLLGDISVPKPQPALPLPDLQPLPENPLGSLEDAIENVVAGATFQGEPVVDSANQRSVVLAGEQEIESSQKQGILTGVRDVEPQDLSVSGIFAQLLDGVGQLPKGLDGVTNLLNNPQAENIIDDISVRFNSRQRIKITLELDDIKALGLDGLSDGKKLTIDISSQVNFNANNLKSLLEGDEGALRATVRNSIKIQFGDQKLVFANTQLLRLSSDGENTSAFVYNKTRISAQNLLGSEPFALGTSEGTNQALGRVEEALSYLSSERERNQLAINAVKSQSLQIRGSLAPENDVDTQLLNTLPEVSSAKFSLNERLSIKLRTDSETAILAQQNVQRLAVSQLLYPTVN